MNNICFLLSFPRSGSTLLQSILATHPKIATRPEDCSLSGVLKTGGNLPQWQQRSIPAKYRAAEFDGYWLEKDVFLHSQTNKLAMIYPDAKFIWLMRSPVDCISSYWLLHSQMRDTPYPIRYFANQWKVFNAARTQIGGHTIQYEDLVANPEVVIAELLDYLGLANRCSIDPASFDQRLALAAKVKHPRVLEAIEVPPSKTEQLDEAVLSELQVTLGEVIEG